VIVPLEIHLRDLAESAIAGIGLLQHSAVDCRRLIAALKDV
jgi:hypothetical protein